MSKTYSRTWWAAMACVSVAAAVAIVCQPAQADEWTGADKAKHAQAGAAVGSIGAALSQSPTAGCLLSVASGVGKELFDMQHPDAHTASFKDAAVTAVAGCLSAKFTDIVIGPRFLGWKKEF